MARAIDQGGYRAVHIADFGMEHEEDTGIWQLANRRGDVVISKDVDFVVLAMADDAVQPVVWIRLGNTRKQQLIQRMMSAMPEIVAALDAGERVVEIR